MEEVPRRDLVVQVVDRIHHHHRCHRLLGQERVPRKVEAHLEVGAHLEVRVVHPKEVRKRLGWDAGVMDVRQRSRWRNQHV